MKRFQVKAIAAVMVETSNEIIEKGDEVVGYLNSWHKDNQWSIQVEMTQECGGVGSGIVVMTVPVEYDSIIESGGKKIKAARNVQSKE